MPQIVGGIDAVKTETVEAVKAAREKALASTDDQEKAQALAKAAAAAGQQEAFDRAKAAEYTKAQESGRPRWTIPVWQRLVCLLRQSPKAATSLSDTRNDSDAADLCWIRSRRKKSPFTAPTSVGFPGSIGFHISLLGIGIFLAGLFTVAQFSVWGNYLPSVYPIHLRGTGESFAANIGGRMIGTSFAALTQYLATMAFVPGASTEAKTAYVATGVAATLFLINLIFSFFLPEPSKVAED